MASAAVFACSRYKLYMVRSHVERRCSVLGPTQSRISPSTISVYEESDNSCCVQQCRSCHAMHSHAHPPAGTEQNDWSVEAPEFDVLRQSELRYDSNFGPSHYYLRIRVDLVIHDSGWVSLAHLLLSWYSSQRGPRMKIR